jgi:NADH:ubiquinone reductase (H+-translocating)
MKKKIIIIGCGFAGSFASRFLCRFRKEAEVTVIDRKQTFDFLPMLPDIVGRGIEPELLTYPLADLTSRLGLNFVNDEVKGVDLASNTVVTSGKSFSYDYLLIASGSETNFYGNQEAAGSAYRLDSVADAKVMINALTDRDIENYLVIGGGYTGVEIASALRQCLDRGALHKKITIIERSSSILGSLPVWMKEYAEDNLQNRLGINIITDAALGGISGGKITLSDGRIFDRAMVVWTAGVRTADFVRNLQAQKNPQGRIETDAYLKIKDNCFVCGDCAYLRYRAGFLRMAAQFSIYQALVAAENIIRSMHRVKLRPYQPVDMGYIIPMANNRSCGRVMGVNIMGRLATFMHFLMCIYRSYGWRNKLGIARSLTQGGNK